MCAKVRKFFKQPNKSAIYFNAVQKLKSGKDRQSDKTGKWAGNDTDYTLAGE